MRFLRREDWRRDRQLRVTGVVCGQCRDQGAGLLEFGLLACEVAAVAPRVLDPRHQKGGVPLELEQQHRCLLSIGVPILPAIPHCLDRGGPR